MTLHTKAVLTFQQVRRDTGIRSGEIAGQAGVSLTDEYLFEIGAQVDDTIKIKVIEAFSALTGHPYTLADFEGLNGKPARPRSQGSEMKKKEKHVS